MWFQSSCFGSKGVKEKDLRRCGCGELFISCSGLLKCRDPPLNLYNRCWISGRQKLWRLSLPHHRPPLDLPKLGFHLKKSSLYQCHKLGVSKVTARVLLLAGEFISGISPCGAVVVVRGWSYCWQGCSWLQHLDQNAFMASILSYFLTLPPPCDISNLFQADTCKLRWFCWWEQLGGVSGAVREEFSIGNSEGKGEESAVENLKTSSLSLQAWDCG